MKIYFRPRGIERVNGQLPVNFPVTDAMIKGLLPSGKSLASEIAAKRVFMIDNSIMGAFFSLNPFYLLNPIYRWDRVRLASHSQDPELYVRAVSAVVL